MAMDYLDRGNPRNCNVQFSLYRDVCRDASWFIFACTSNSSSFYNIAVNLYITRYANYMAMQKYYGNTCPKCGVLYGDFFLHGEPGSPFFPQRKEKAKFLYIKEIPLSKSIEISAGLHLGLGEIILSNAKRV